MPITRAEAVDRVREIRAIIADVPREKSYWEKLTIMQRLQFIRLELEEYRKENPDD